MSEPKMLSLQQAVKLATDLGVRRCDATLVNWAKKHGVGHQIGGKNGDWLFNETKLRAFLVGDTPKEVLNGEG